MCHESRLARRPLSPRGRTRRIAPRVPLGPRRETRADRKRAAALSGDRDYLLGTHDQEVRRLGVQHAVWRARVLDAWQRAGFGPGQAILDLGCGPGYAALDLAEVVGPT